jgi:hypothetical protein
MARRGRGAAALATAAVGSFVAGTPGHGRAHARGAAPGRGGAPLRACRVTMPSVVPRKKLTQCGDTPVGISATILSDAGSSTSTALTPASVKYTALPS